MMIGWRGSGLLGLDREAKHARIEGDGGPIKVLGGIVEGEGGGGENE